MNKSQHILCSILFPSTLILLICLIGTTKVGKGVSTNYNDKYNINSKISLKPQITDSIGIKKIDREKVLKEFFSKYKSPLIDHTDTFIDVADKHGLDFRLLPAISCIESSCGKKLIPDSYNPFGWGIYGNNVLKFKSYDEAIETVGEGLKKNYIAKGFDTPEKIAPIYTPPGHKNWLRSVNFFVGEINKL